MGDDAIWTANNEGRSVSRIEPEVEHGHGHDRPPLPGGGSAAGGGSIWASQFEDSSERWVRGHVLVEGGARRQSTGEATSYPVTAMSVSSGVDALWTVVPGRHGNRVVRLEVDR